MQDILAVTAEELRYLNF